MKILHISRTMGQGGAEKVVYQLCRDDKADKQMVASCGGEYVNELKKLGIFHISIPDIANKRPILILHCLYILWKTVYKEKVEIIHSHHRMAAFYGRIIQILTGVKHIYTAHNVFYDKKGLMRFALTDCQIVAVGDGVKDNLTDVYGINSNRIHVIYNSVIPMKTGEFNEQLVKVRRKFKTVIGSIGRITEQKGMDIFLKAMKSVISCKPDVAGIIVGDGKDLTKIKALANELKIEDNILFLGYQKNIIDIIGQIDFVVLASRWEGLPLVPIETFSQGKTIIASDISGNNEVIKDGSNGILFESENVRVLANKILLLAENPSMRQQLEKNAITTYKEKYSYDNFISKYKQIYRDM